MKTLLRIVIAVGRLGFAGCSSVKVGGSLVPGVAPQIGQDTRCYVAKLPADEREIDKVIVSDLEPRGLTVEVRR